MAQSRIPLFFFSFFLLWNSLKADSSEKEMVYKVKGGEVTLTTSHVDPIKKVQWNHDGNIAAELYEGKTECFRQFKGRCSLNSSTGALTITGLKASDSGLYKPEINDQSKTPTRLSVISAVSTPSISKSCDSVNTYCNLTCESNTIDAEPITYKWFEGNTELSSSKTFEITKDMKEKSFSCMLSNPVSKADSPSFSNPFISRNLSDGAIAGIIVGVIVLIVLIIVIIFVAKKKGCWKRKGEWSPSKSKQEKGTPEENLEMLEGPKKDQHTIYIDVERGPSSASAGLPNGNIVTEERGPSSSPAVAQNGHVVTVDISPEQRASSALAVPENGCNGAEVPGKLSLDPPQAASPDANEETELTSAVDKTSNPDQASPASPQTTEETGNSVEKLSSKRTPDEEPPVDEQEADEPGDDNKS